MIPGFWSSIADPYGGGGPGGAASARPSADPLTGLALRSELVARIRDALADPDPRALVVLAVRIENLRGINTLHGIAAGDQVLTTVAGRLAVETRSPFAVEKDAAPQDRELVARLGAGEFGIVCASPTPPRAETEALAAHLLRIVQNAIRIGDLVVRPAAAIGVVATTERHQDAGDVLRDLDLALRQARNLGPGKVVFWEPALTERAIRRCTLAEELRRAFENSEFLLHYQPILRLDDQRMVGVEALLRWNHPRDGLAPTAAFVPALEEIGLLQEVGCWVVREAVRQIESWRTLYGRNIVDWVGVNLSACQLNDPAALLTTLRGIHAGGFSVHRLRPEIAETVLMRDPPVSEAVIAELADLGIGFAIDDFGTGSASLECLHRFPVDTVKIDGAFVRQIGTPDGDRLLQALVDVASMSGATITAEGIETAVQRDFLRSIGCEFGQGYLLAAPMDGALLGAFALTHAAATGSSGAG